MTHNYTVFVLEVLTRGHHTTNELKKDSICLLVILTMTMTNLTVSKQHLPKLA